MNEEKLKSAASEAARRMLDTLPEDCAHDFSPRFQRKMRALLRREEHPVLSRSLKSVASIALVLFLGFGITMTARSTQVVWEAEPVGQGVRYYNVNQITPSETLAFKPFWLPERVEPRERKSGETSGYSFFEDRRNGGKIISFFYYYGVKEGTEAIVVGQYGEVEQISVTINGMEATLFLQKDDVYENELVWIDKDQGVLFRLSGFLTQQELIRIAESVDQIEYIP